MSVNLNAVREWVIQFLENTWKNIDWLIQHMDMTQWAIVAVIFGVLGVLALRSTR
ncbi:MAG: hypothetical protein U0892_03905 [Pirellulales bacterium]